MQRSTRHLRRGGTSVLLDTTGTAVPRIVHWGPDLGDLDQADLDALALAAIPQRVSGSLDEPAALSLVPLESEGWLAAPGLDGAHEREVSAVLLHTDSIDADGEHPDSAVVIRASSERLAVTIELEVTASGLLRQRLSVTNLDERAFELAALDAVFPVPATARELLDTSGRHLRERTPQRHAFTIGEHVRSSRRGRPGADATLLLTAGTPGFGFERGLVHAVHLAWSGNHRMRAERVVSGEALLAAGELIRPGEIVLASGETYSSPVALGSWGDGLTALSSRFHDELRARPRHPSRPRPVTLNTWEAVYFDHSLERLTALADRAATVGVERFVLDDGWFLGRRDDTAGLGDWTVDRAVWPDGLGPLAEHVTGLGMEFGLWVEPEMINPDSELARAHPDWILGVAGRLPRVARQQQVLDLANPEAFDHILGALDALLVEYPISYLKWDHNRDLLEAVDPASGRALVHEQTLALYALLDTLKERHPDLEIESCASGGARVDLGILERTDRIWTSDCIDPLERAVIEKYTGLLVPPELLGSHIAGPESHSTHRAHSLSFRASTALFGHFGIEWDIASIDEETAEELAAWVALHRRHRPLLHTGRRVRVDRPDAESELYGVVAVDGSEALYAFAQLRTSDSYPTGRVTLPGLEPDRRYRVSIVTATEPDGVTSFTGAGQSPLPWAGADTILRGSSLDTVGLQAPVIPPEQIVLVRAVAVD